MVDVKTGKPKDSHVVQVLLYLWMLPLAIPVFRDKQLRGRLVYPNGTQEISAALLTDDFVTRASVLIRLLGARTPGRKVPSVAECRFCPISAADCPERIEGVVAEGMTDVF